MICNYCEKPAEKVSGKVIYPRMSKLHGKLFFICRPCDAYVGTHADGRPLGNLADRDTRRFRMKAHHYFDKVWKDRHMKRTDAYAWMASSLGIPVSKCHIGMFDIEMCVKVIQICQDGFDIRE